MLTLLFSPDWIVGRDRILQMVAQDVRNEKTGCILMVPELISHDMERRLCAVAGDTASRFAEVLSFTRLANRVDEALGNGSPEFLDNGGRIVAMAAAAMQLHNKLKAFASVETKPEFLMALLDAVDEFKCCCITAEDIRHSSKSTEGSLAQKLEEIALLLEAYDAICARGKRDPRDQMTWLLEELEASDYAINHRFYIDGFPDFTKQHMDILEYLISTNTQIVISLNCDQPDTDNPAFEKVSRTALQLIRIAQKYGIEFNCQTMQNLRNPTAGLGRLLFQGELESGCYRDSLSVCRTETVYDECCIAADRILELITSGVRFRDIGVVCSDIASYKSTIHTVFRRCSIPLYLSGTEDILDKSVLDTILTALDAVLSGFEQSDVLRYMKSLLSPVDVAVCDNIENYAILWNINGSKWTKEWTNHPYEISGKWTEHAKKALDDLECARKKAMAPLIKLRDGLFQALNLQQQVTALYTFLQDIGFADSLSKLAAQMDASADGRTSQILNQLWDIILSALEQLHDVLGETNWDVETFSRLFELILSQYDVGTIPPVLDAVTVGTPAAMRCQETKYLFVLGALEGNLPQYGSTMGVLSDQDRNDLIRLGLPVNGGSIDNLQVNFGEIYGVFNGAQNKIYVSCPSGQPSYVYRRLCVLSGNEIMNQPYLGAVLTDPMEAAAYLSRGDNVDSAKYLGIFDQYQSVNRKKNHGLGRITEETIRKLYSDKLRLSASQIDKQGQCRLSYFLRYGLRIQERKAASVDPSEFGTYVHAVMENTVRTVMEKGGFLKVSLEQMQDIAAQYSEQYAAERFRELDSERMNYLFKRNTFELQLVVRELWQEMQSCDFLPVGFEVGFGEGLQMPSVCVSGKNMEAYLMGFVDRVDLWKGPYSSYFRVVDYKTGKKDFDYCDVFNGIGLQMLLYLFALEDEGQLLLGDNPQYAGVQYFPARVPFVSADGSLTAEEAEKEREALWKRKGLILSDEDVLFAMEKSDTPKRLSCKRKKDGTLAGDLANREQFSLLRKHVFDVVGRMVDDIASGNVEPNPYTRGQAHNACTYCPYGAICHSAYVAGRRNYKAMSAQRFWEEIEKEVADNG